jgi:putative membrane protein
MPAPLAHAGVVAPHDLGTAWPQVPGVWVAVVLAALLYAGGAARLRAGEAGRRALPRWRVGCAAAAAVVALAALATPLEPLAGTLFAAHMLQHELLVLLVAPLVVCARPVVTLTMALPRAWRRRMLTLPRPGFQRRGTPAVVAAAVVAHAVTLWTWHVPGLYEAALASPAVHALEHATMTAGAIPLWWLAAGPTGRRVGAPVVLGLLLAAIQASVLAGLLTFAGRALYDLPAAGLAAWGLSALDDQQAAGGLMWFPGSLAYVVAGSAAVLRWLHRDEDLHPAVPADAPTGASP